MKRTLLALIFSICCTYICKADDFERLKENITAEYLSNESRQVIVKELIGRYPASSVDIDNRLLRVLEYSAPKDRDIETLLKSMNNDGSWSDIDYTSLSRSAWTTQNHVHNILLLARAYRSPRSKFYNDPTLIKSISKSIEYWSDGNFKCPNWWFNDIGVPKVMAPALLLLEDHLSPEVMAKGIEILEPAERVMTGQNKVWLNSITLIKGVLLRDDSIVTRTSSAIKEELRISDNEGIQSDYSYHQHGAMLQFGNYGLSFASSISYWLKVLNNTAYDFTDEQKEIMRNYMARGINVSVWNGYMDVSSCGRQLFLNSMSSKASSLLSTNLDMIEVDPENRELYEDYITRNFIYPTKNNLVGNFAYPKSKYTIHRTDDFFFSVKMFSDKVMGGEVTNNENQKGYHLADGATMIYCSGEEYNNIFPIWDGKYMPGTTVEINNDPLKILGHSREYINGSDFAGCMSGGDYGLAAFKYRRDGVKANKSWFFIGSTVICLGNSIESERGDDLVTTLNQCNLQDRDSALYDTSSGVCKVEIGSLYSSKKVFCDGVGYESLDDSEIEFIAKEQVGDWHDVAHFYPSKEVRGEVFTAQIKHTAKEGNRYAYAIRPAINSTDLFDANNSSKDSFEIVQNDGNATIIESKTLNIAMVVFWRAGDVKSKLFKKISAEEPVMVIVKKINNNIEYQTYEPSSQRSVKITIGE